LKNGHFWNVQFSFFQKSLEKAIFVTEKKFSVWFLKIFFQFCDDKFFFKKPLGFFCYPQKHKNGNFLSQKIPKKSQYFLFTFLSTQYSFYYNCYVKIFLDHNSKMITMITICPKKSQQDTNLIFLYMIMFFIVINKI